MELSSFPKIHLPKDKSEKRALAKYASNPHFPEILSSPDIKSLIKIVTTVGYSPSIFNGVRKQANFSHADFMILDIDNGLTIDEALHKVEELDLLCICLPTSSHTVKLNKFRLIFPLDKRINNIKEFNYNIKQLFKSFPESDKSCLECARFYFPSTLSDEGFVYEGQLLTVERPIEPRELNFNPQHMITITEDVKDISEALYGQDKHTIPKCVDYFIKNASGGLPGEWNNCLNAVCFTFGLEGLPFDKIYGIIEQVAPYDLDNRDDYTINRAYEQGSESRVEKE